MLPCGDGAAGGHGQGCLSSQAVQIRGVARGASRLLAGGDPLVLGPSKRWPPLGRDCASGRLHAHAGTVAAPVGASVGPVVVVGAAGLF